MPDVTYKSNAAAIVDAMKQSVEFAVGTAAERVADRARENCPVGTITRAGHTWKERKPGFLRSTIFARVRWMKDGTGDCVAWVKAGTQGAPDKLSGFYAPFVEFGYKSTAGNHIAPNPFMRNAFREVTLADIAEIVALEFSSIKRVGVKK